MALRPATEADWHAVVGQRCPDEWWGYAEDTPHLIEGLGAVFRGGDARLWLTFWRCPGVQKLKSAHAGAKRLICEAEAKGEPLYAMPEPGIAGADVWLRRLGFVETEETRLGGIPVWVRN